MNALVPSFDHSPTSTDAWLASASGVYRRHPEHARLVREGIARSGGTIKQPRLSLAEAGGA
jgi:hypothetical protein